ncbi:SDR family NAD(P)-dependent oxidoreductase [Ochrovirga pacifica]|uniref:SDR family NAD(P)-dependent oxidoreductase n=1 Tax=Ochrovirga pacifica TaxID=1042376 RepID=UPI000255A2C8|nr:SDR family oxidoreductase [Ochrovirga pacifica]
MDLGLQDKLVLVTASSGGIGQAIATTFAEEGAKVIVNGRTTEKVENAILSIKKEVPNAQLVSLVANNATKEGCDKTIAKFPEIDILVNCLGIYEAPGFFNEMDENWQNLFETNVMSGVRLARHYLKSMLVKKKGRIVFISSESAISPAPEMVHYSATKTMQLSISRALAEMTKNTGVTVNSVLPGPTKTSNVEKFVGDLFPELSQEEAEKKFIEENRPTSLIQRFINPNEIANTVVFISSNIASAINGSNIRVDGGLVRSVF